MQSIFNKYRHYYLNSDILKKLLSQVCLAAFLVLPINNLPYFESYLGELSVEATTYPFLFAVVIYVYLLFKKSVEIPRYSSFHLLLIFFGVIIISGIFNIDAIVNSSIKGSVGLVKFIRQSMVVFFMFFVCLCFYETIKNLMLLRKLLVIRTFIAISMALVFLYSFVEVSTFHYDGVPRELLYVFDSVIHRDVFYVKRVRSLSGEPSFLGLYLVVAFPWILSYCFEQGKMKVVGLLFLLLTAFFSMLTFSRTVYLLLCVEALVYFMCYFYIRSACNWSRVVDLLLVLIAIIMGLSSASIVSVQGDFSVGNVVNSLRVDKVFVSEMSNQEAFAVSNIGRLGSQMAAINMARDNSILGVGLGQYGFHMSAYVPEWAWDSPEIKDWASAEVGTRWPLVHGLYARIAAELGLFGVFCFLGSMFLVMWRSVTLFFRRPKSSHLELFEPSMAAMFLGVFLSGFIYYSFRYFGFWLVFSFGWAYLEVFGYGKKPHV